MNDRYDNLLLAFFEHWMEKRNTDLDCAVTGLCLRLKAFMYSKEEDTFPVLGRMLRLFEMDDLNLCTPFNPTLEQYTRECEDAVCGKQIIRVYWVARQIVKLRGG